MKKLINQNDQVLNLRFDKISGMNIKLGRSIKATQAAKQHHKYYDDPDKPKAENLIDVVQIRKNYWNKGR